MLIHLNRPRSVLRFPTPFSSTQLPNLFWISTGPAQTSTHPDPIDHLRTFLGAGRDRRNSDYDIAFVSALKSCASLSAISLGQQIHCLVLKSSLDSNTFVRNSLINLYAKCGFISDAELMFGSCSDMGPVSYNIIISGYVRFGRLDHALRLFEKMPSKNRVSYLTMINGFAQNDRWVEAIEVFRDMRSVGMAPNDFALSSVICSCCSIMVGIWNCRMLHALAIKLQLEGLVLVSTNLVRMYCVCSSLWDARTLFEEMPERNTVSWNVMLNGYSKAGRVDSARELFDRILMKDMVSWGTMINGYLQLKWLSEAFTMYHAMLSTGLAPNDVMIWDLISACGQSMAIDKGEQLHSTIIKIGFDCYEFIQATIIHFYAACGKVDLASLQFEVAVKDHLPCWNALVAGFIRNGLIDHAREIFNQMLERDVFSWTAMISGHTQDEKPNMALELFHEMIACGVPPNEVTMVSVFSAIAALGMLKEGIWAHEYVRNNSIPLSDELSAALIDMYAKCGSISTALEVFYQIKDKASTSSPWNAIICGLAMHGHARLSLKIFSNLLQRRHIKLNDITFIGVLTACCHAGFVDLGEEYFKSMKSVYNVEPNIKHFGCMVDLYGRAGRLLEAEETIRSMPMKADSVIWSTLLAASKTHGNVEIGERAAETLARLEPCHGAGRVLLSNLYAEAGRWEDAFLIRKTMQSRGLKKSSGRSVV